MDAYKQLASETVRKFDHEAPEDGPAIVLPIITIFALLAEPGGYDPAELIRVFTEKAFNKVDLYSPNHLKFLLESLATPGHSYVPSQEILDAFSARVSRGRVESWPLIALLFAK